MRCTALVLLTSGHNPLFVTSTWPLYKASAGSGIVPGQRLPTCLLQAVKDFFIWLPNGIGAVFAIGLTVLCLIFPKSPKAGSDAGGAA